MSPANLEWGIVFTPEIGDFADVSDIAHFAGTWGALGNYSTDDILLGLWFASSADAGGPWEPVSVTTSEYSNAFRMTWDGNEWLIVGSREISVSYGVYQTRRHYWTASDPSGPWTEHVGPGDYSTSPADGNTHTATDGTHWVVVNGLSQMYTATSPAGTWTQRTALIEAWADLVDFSGLSGRSIVSLQHLAGEWLAVTQELPYDAGPPVARLWSSPDPTGSWNQEAVFSDVAGSYFFDGVVANDDGYVVQIGSRLFTSETLGGDWTEVTPGGQLRRLAYGEGEYRTIYAVDISSSDIAEADAPGGPYEAEDLDLDISGAAAVAYGGGQWLAIGYEYPTFYLLAPTTLGGTGWGLTL